MNYIRIDRFGEYLIVRKKDLSKENFFEALKCEPTINTSLQNDLYKLFCFQGISIDEMFLHYKKNFPNSKFELNDFISWRFNISHEIIANFLCSKKEDEVCYFVDSGLINGYNENFLLNSDYIDDSPEILEFQKAFKEAIKNL